MVYNNCYSCVCTQDKFSEQSEITSTECNVILQMSLQTIVIVVHLRRAQMHMKRHKLPLCRLKLILTWRMLRVIHVNRYVNA